MVANAPGMAADIVDKARQRRWWDADSMDEVLSETTGLPVVIADEALSCVVLGTGRCLEEMRTKKRLDQSLLSVRQ